MIETLYFVYFVIFLAFVFDFLNGLHDAPNSIATMVATGVLKPFHAVIWSAFFNCIAFLFFKLNVATTIGSGIIQPTLITPYMLFSALLGAISWNVITWRLGLPASSSHALIGGLIGAAWIALGWPGLHWSGLLPILFALVASPIFGLIMSYSLIKLLQRVVGNRHTQSMTPWAKRAQFLSAAFLSLGHGGNDAQKTMGIVSGLLFSANLLGPNFYIPFWVVMSCNLIMGMGTLFGGWRIVNTLGHKITRLTPESGGCISTGAAITLLIAMEWGIPVSTTHTVTGAIVGSGLSKGRNEVQWPVVYSILWSWVLTIPAAAIFSASVMALR